MWHFLHCGQVFRSDKSFFILIIIIYQLSSKIITFNNFLPKTYCSIDNVMTQCPLIGRHHQCYTHSSSINAKEVWGYGTSKVVHSFYWLKIGLDMKVVKFDDNNCIGWCQSVKIDKLCIDYVFFRNFSTSVSIDTD